jgi:cytochrome c biogenesis protein CcmG/thiol:disulfide interchange protein DsbE
MSDQPGGVTGQHDVVASRPADPAPQVPAGRLAGQGWRGSRATMIAVLAATLAIAVIAVVSLAGGGAPPRALPVARSFSLPALGHPGQRVSLAAYAGRPVIINFFASWCAPCQRETPALARFYRQAGDRVTIIGVDSNDPAGRALRFVRQAGVRYPVGADPFPAATTTSYGVIALPQTFFLDARHRIVKRVFGAVTEKELSAGVALMNRASGAPSAASGAGGG